MAGRRRISYCLTTGACVVLVVVVVVVDGELVLVLAVLLTTVTDALLTVKLLSDTVAEPSDDSLGAGSTCTSS